MIPSLLLSAFLFYAFNVVEESFARELVISDRLVLIRTMACACLTHWFFIMIVYTMEFYITSGPRLLRHSCWRFTHLFSVITAIGSLMPGIITSRTERSRHVNMAILLFMPFVAIRIAMSTLPAPICTKVLSLGMVRLTSEGMLTVTLVALLNAFSCEEHTQRNLAIWGSVTEVMAHARWGFCANEWATISVTNPRFDGFRFTGYVVGVVDWLDHAY